MLKEAKCVGELEATDSLILWHGTDDLRLGDLLRYTVGGISSRPQFAKGFVKGII